MKKKIISFNLLIMVAVCSLLAGMLIASSFKLPAIGEAKEFWHVGEADDAVKVVMPSLKSLADSVRPTVVSISTTKVVSSRDMYKRFMPPGGPFDEFFDRFNEGDKGEEFKQRGLGSGFIISADGYILTNNHVIAESEEIRVTLADGSDYEAQIVGRDDKSDIALIKIDPGRKALPYSKLGDSDKLEIGDWVIAMGNPFGFGHTLTQGIVSAKARDIGAGLYDYFIQTDAAINPGNSGGPMVDMRGHVVGINTAIISTGQGIGFAIPINMVTDILSELKQTGQVSRGWLGVAVQPVTPEIARATGLDGKRGAMISRVYPGDPADKAGIKAGDIIIKVQAGAINNPHDLTRMVGSFKPGARIEVTVWREGKELVLEVRLDERLDEHVAELDSSAPGKAGEAKDRLGLTVGNITKELARQFNVEDPKGVILLDIDAAGLAAAAGLRRGDVIREVNRQVVRDIDEYQALLNSMQSDETALLLINRGGSPLYVAVDLK